MAEINDGGQAFPIPGYDGIDHHEPSYEGMTLRDYFAGQALIGLITNPQTLHPSAPLSARAYEIADAMLAYHASQARPDEQKETR